jgi:salicylate biosynthesis isochorismate synthase
MEGVKSAVLQVVGVSRPVGAAAASRLPGALGPPSLLWRDGRHHYQGVGEAAVLAGPDVAEVLNAAAEATVHVTGEPVAPPAPWFGGFAFDAAAPQDAWWERFPAARAFIPELLFAQDGERGSLTAFVPVGPDGEAAARAHAADALEVALARQAASPPLGSGLGTVSLREDRAAWEVLVERALAALRSGGLRKVVLARAMDLVTEAPFDVMQALERAEAAAGGAVVFAVRGPDETTFFGASPERLVRVKGQHFSTQALAGSAEPADAERLSNSKETWEHSAVVEDVREALRAVAARVEVAAATPVSLGYVTHLDAAMEGTLRPGVTPVQVALALHPTAAVGGMPRDAARAFLRTHERLARGWYAGALGWVGADAVDLRVALRCALVRGRAARLFVGAGVVEGSSAAGEWTETRRKAVPMLHALLGETPWPR